MRIKNLDLERKANILEPRSKLFLMMEGTDTEPLYFQAYFSRREDVEYLPFERESIDLGWSNPQVLMTQLKLELGCEISSLTYADFAPFLIRYLKGNNPSLDTSLFKREFNDCLHKKKLLLRHNCDEKTIEEILEKLKDTSFKQLIYGGLKEVRGEFSTLIGEDHYYDADTDEIALVVDRDAQSISSFQFDRVVREGEANNIQVYVTNPCFEFFLALHWSDLEFADQDKLLSNPKEGGLTYAHRLLLGLDPNYQKDSYDAGLYVSKSQDALAHLEKYEQDLKMLKDRVGSNLAGLLKHK